jgi:hypothetical protein
MMMHGMFAAKSVSMVLISMGIGYLVCVKAEKEQGFLKQLGYWIGSIIIVVSILLALHAVYLKACHKMNKHCMPEKICPMMKR